MTSSKLRPTEVAAEPNRSPSADYLPVRQLVRERLELSNSADAHVIVDDLLGDLPDNLLHLAARKGLYTLAGEISRDGLRPRSPKSSPDGSAKWDGVARAEIERPDIFGVRVAVGVRPDGTGISKFLGDCTKVDLANAEQLKRTHAAGVVAAADRFARLRKLVKANQVVRDVDRSKVEAIFNA